MLITPRNANEYMFTILTWQDAQTREFSEMWYYQVLWITSYRRIDFEA